MSFEIRTAAELADLALPGSWAVRRTAREDAVLHTVWQRFLDDGGPVPIAAVERMGEGSAAVDVRAALGVLDAADLLVLEGEFIQLAYPFTTGPNAFAVEVAPGVERYACCAVDALGLAPMLGHAVTIHARCHHCAERLTIHATPDAALSLPDALVWIAPRDACAERVAAGL